jgi:hypothetical protein
MHNRPPGVADKVGPLFEIRLHCVDTTLSDSESHHPIMFRTSRESTTIIFLLANYKALKHPQVHDAYPHDQCSRKVGSSL